MEQPFLTHWKQAQVTRVSTFLAEQPTAGWKPRTGGNIWGGGGGLGVA